MKSTFRIGIAACGLVVLAGLAGASTQIPGKAQDRPIALIGGTIHPVNGPEIPGGTIVFAEGTIIAIGQQVDIPMEAERIDVRGRHLYPGLIDAYSRIGLTEIGAVRATNDSREVGRINPNVKAEVAVNPESEIIPVTRSNGVLMALTVPSGGVISGTSALLYMDGWTWEDMTLKAPVAMHMSWPRMNPITAWWMEKSEDEQIKERDENLRWIAQTFADARAYQTAREAAGQPGVPPQAYDSRWEAMLPLLDRRIPVVINANEIQQIQAAAAFAERENLRLIVHGGYDAPYCTALLKRLDAAVIVSPVHRNPMRRGDGYNDAFTVPQKLHEAGIRFCIADGGGAANVRNLPYHAARAVAHGLSREEALKAITLYPAQILGAADRVGSLETGKEATIIVTDGDILEITTHVELGFIQGRRLDLSDKQKLLWMKYREKYQRMGLSD